MTRRAINGYRTSAFALWTLGLLWALIGPDAPGVHRVIVGAAVAATVLAGIGAALLDLRQATLFALEAGRRQADRDRSTID